MEATDRVNVHTHDSAEVPILAHRRYISSLFCHFTYFVVRSKFIWLFANPYKTYFDDMQDKRVMYS